MPPIAIAGVAAAGSVVGGLISSSAASSAGEATLAASQQQVAYAKQAADQQRADRGTAVGLAQQYGGMSADEYRSIQNIVGTQGQALTASLASIQKQQAALDAVDPSVKASGQNLLDLLNGHASAQLAPVQSQLAQQRTALQGQLASQLGPGYQTSSAGIQALLQFDQQSAITLNGIQQNALSQATSTYSTLFGQQQSGQQSIGSQTQGAFGASQQANESVFGAYNNIQSRLDNSVLSAFNQNSPNYNAVTQAAGSVTAASGLPFAGQQSLGGTVSGLAGGLGQVAGQMYGQQQQAATLDKYLGGGSNSQSALPAAGIPGASLGVNTTLPSYTVPNFVTGRAG